MKKYIVIKLDQGAVEIVSKVAGQIYRHEDDTEALRRARIHANIMKIGEPYAEFKVYEEVEDAAA